MSYIDQPQAIVLADSVSPEGKRLTTLQVTMHRWVLAEFNTHRVFCLAGDSELEFDLPTRKDGNRRVYKMRLDEFVDKWKNGAAPRRNNPGKTYDLSRLSGGWYSAQKLSDLTGMSKTAIHNAARLGWIDRKKENNTVYTTGSSFIEWRHSRGDKNRQDVRSRLQDMNIRQLNEDTGLIQTSNVVDAVYSGKKEVFEVTAEGFSVAGSKDHRIMTTDGWKTIEELVPDETEIVVRKFGVLDSDRRDEKRLKKIDGQWRSVYQRNMRAVLLDEHGGCQDCGVSVDLHVHHIKSVHEYPELAFEYDNLELLCGDHHKTRHEEQGWQVSQYLYGSSVVVESVESMGEQDTYDLEIAGEYPNFLANGVVVHNSRNSASSRAIPAHKNITRVRERPALPLAWPERQKGMQGGEDLSESRAEAAKMRWEILAKRVANEAEKLNELGVHKSVTNRLLEPFLYQTIIVSSTEWSNFLYLRDSEMAQPEIAVPAKMMRHALENSEPWELDYGEWHLPLTNINDEDTLHLIAAGHELDEVEDHDEMLKKVSAARCARVSYLTHDGRRDVSADLDLYERLVKHGHWSPLEHVATPCRGHDGRVPTGEQFMSTKDKHLGNFFGWDQLRHEVGG